MADDISVVVKVVGNKEIVSTTNNLKKMETGVKKLAQDLTKGRITGEQYNKGLKELRQTVDKSFSSWQQAKSAVDKYSRELKSLTATQKQAKAAAQAEAAANKAYAQARREATEANRRFDAEAKKAAATSRQQALENRKLRMEFKEGYAAQVQLRAAQMRLNQARSQGIITDQQYQKQLNSLTLSTQVAGRRMNSTGMAMQQTGYQVGDFLVQVQSGTNAMVAFGQQATQLVGILPMFNSFMGLSGTALVALSAGLGIAIPLLTAIGAAFMRTRPPAEKAKTTFEGVKDSLDAIESVNFSGLGEEFLEVAKDIKVEFQDILKVIDDIAKRELESSLKAPLDAVIAELESFQVRASIAAQLGSATPAFGGELGLESMNEALFLATQLKRLNGETKEELQGQLQAITEALFLRGLLTEEVQVMLGELATEVSLVEDLENKISDAAEEADNLKTALVLSDAEYQQLLYYQQYAETMAIGLRKAADEAGRLKTNLTDPQFQQMLYYQQYAETVGAAPDEPVKSPKVTGGGGGTTQKTSGELAAESVAKLQAQLDLQRELIGMTEEEAHVRQSLGETYSNVSQETITNLQQQYAETQKLLDLQKQQETIANTVANSFANAFTAMVEGTMSVKDAFRNMAREIIKQLWEIFVVQKIVGVVSQAFGVPKAVTDPAVSAMMSSWDGGGYTGSGARSGGMDGKGGFVAMLHPQETVVDHTKGQSTGGGQPVVINQSFNFSANGDDSVKKIIAQAAPQIAQMTQKSMMDQRRRGGSMKSTFG